MSTTENKPAPATRARSVRIATNVWDQAKVRAAEDEVTMSEVLQRLVQGYAEGQINIPRAVLVYDDVRPKD